MPTQKLTNKTVENAKPQTHGRVVIWDSIIGNDTTLPGSFGLRITDKGAKTWVVMYRVENGQSVGKRRQRFLTLGRYPAIPLALAREQAREALKKAGRNIDPIEEEKSVKRARANEKTVNQAVTQFIERYAKRENQSWREVRRVFQVYVLPYWADRRLQEISPADVHEILDRLVDANHPYMANRLLAHVRKFFSWCKERHWLTEIPTEEIKPPGKEESRDRILDKNEITRFWLACDDLGWPFGTCFKLLLLLGQRRNEVAHMKWDHVKFEDALWTLPKQETKAGRRHEVPLAPMVMQMLEHVPRTGQFVLSTTGNTPISGFSKAKNRLDKLSEVANWRLHDLRRTAASGMAEIGIAPHVIEKILNHSSGQISGIAAIYNRHAYLREKTDALNAWALKLEATIGASGNNIVLLRKGIP